jgi:hypothetical protein
MQMAQKILRHFYDYFRMKNGFFYSFNVKLRGAALLRRPARTPGWAVVIARNDAFSY